MAGTLSRRIGRRFPAPRRGGAGGQPPPDQPPALVFYVDPAQPDDSGNGLSPAAAKKTLSAAREALRSATGRTATAWSSVPGTWDGAWIVLANGIYYVGEETGDHFTLDGRDSGTPSAPVQFRAAEGATPIITAAQSVTQGDWVLLDSSDTTAWARIPAGIRANVYKVNLAGRMADFGEQSYHDGGRQLFLIAGNQMVPFSRYLTDDTQWHVASENGGTNTLKTTAARMAAYDFNAQKPLVVGMPSVEYEVNWLEVTSLAEASGTYTLSTQTAYGQHYGYGWTVSSAQGSNSCRFKIFNAFEDLAPGYCVWNVDTKNLYYLPASGGAPTDARVSEFAGIMTAAGANWQTWQGITFEGARNLMCKVHDATGFVMDGCEFRDYANIGVRFGNNRGGPIWIYHVIDGACWECGIRNSTFRRGGSHGMEGRSGNRTELEDGACFFTGNALVDMGWSNFSGGIYLYGHGWDVGYNLLDGSLGVAVQINGNKTDFHHNTVRQCCKVLGDAGALYSGRSHTRMQNSVRLNEFRNNGSNGRTTPPHISWGSSWHIYLDDAVANFEISDNLIANDNASIGGAAIYHGSGRRTVLTDNVCTNTHYVADIRHNHSITHAERWGHETHQQDKDDIDGYGKGVSDAPWSTTAPYSILKDDPTDSTMEKPANCNVTGNRCTSHPVLSEMWDAASAPGTGAIQYFSLSQVNKNQAGADVPLSDLISVYQY